MFNILEAFHPVDKSLYRKIKYYCVTITYKNTSPPHNSINFLQKVSLGNNYRYCKNALKFLVFIFGTKIL